MQSCQFANSVIEHGAGRFLLSAACCFLLAVNNEYSITLLRKCSAMADDFKFLEPVVNTFVPGNFATHFLQIPAC